MNPPTFGGHLLLKYNNKSFLAALLIYKVGYIIVTLWYNFYIVFISSNLWVHNVLQGVL